MISGSAAGASAIDSALTAVGASARTAASPRLKKRFFIIYLLIWK
jgi:hypothetical protein